jgi:hypothetical protein
MYVDPAGGRSIDAVEHARLEWVDWFDNRRPPEPIGNVSRAEFERAYYRSQAAHAVAASVTHRSSDANAVNRPEALCQECAELSLGVA